MPVAPRRTSATQPPALASKTQTPKTETRIRHVRSRCCGRRRCQVPAGPSVTTPTEPAPHGAPPRGLTTTPSSSTTTGRFGRMFRHLPVYAHAPRTLVELAETMIQPLEDGQL